MEDGALWVFGYGSLIWDPGFVAAERQVARVSDYRRSFCMASVHYRGTPDAPGLVLALDASPGAVCDGVAFRVAPADAASTQDDLRKRELVSYAYVERMLPVVLADGRRVAALAYVIAPGHAQYRGNLPLADQAAIIARAAGTRGPNRDYLRHTVAHLATLGILDPDLVWLDERVAELVKKPDR